MNAVLKCLSQAASVLTCCSLALNAQTSGVSTKTINIERFQKDTPLYVVAFRMGDEVKHVVPRSNAATFESGNDWLRHVSITVQNACNKTMTGVVVHLDFPDTESVPMNRVRLAHEFHFGATPQRSMYRQDGTALRA